MLKVENIHFQYGPRTVLANLNFEISKGKLVGFLGPNGAGKTTTLNLITGLYYPTSGDVFIAGESMKTNPLRAKAHIGFLPEQAPLYREMTVIDYLLFVAEIKGVTQENLNLFVNEALEKTNLVEVKHRMIDRLSKGFRQRVGLAQALVSRPDLIVMDEPTVGFDPQQVNEFKKLLLSLREQYTVLWSTHILADVEDVCDEVIVLNQGQIVMQGNPHQMRAAQQLQQTLVLKVRRSSETFLQKVKSCHGVNEVIYQESASHYKITYLHEDTVEQILLLATQENVGILRVDHERQTLQDLFLNVTKNEKGN